MRASALQPAAGTHCARRGARRLACGARAAEAPRLWQGITIEAGWEDALEAVLRERLNALHSTLDRAARLACGCAAGQAERRRASAEARTRRLRCKAPESLQRYVTYRDPRLEAALREWLHQSTCCRWRRGSGAAHTLPAGAMLVSREGHIYTRHSVSFHAPDTELHGVLSRQREIEALEVTCGREREAHACAVRGCSARGGDRAA
jgi:chromosome segregation protein